MRFRDGLSFNHIQKTSPPEPRDILTLVSYISLDQRRAFDAAVARLRQSGLKFDAAAVHCTWQTIFDPLRGSAPFLTREQRALLVADVIAGTQDVLRDVGPLDLTMNNVRPGLLIDEPTKTLVPGATEGTVVVMATPETAAAFLQTSAHIRERLAEPLRRDYKVEVKRLLPGVWLTLGRFDIEDKDEVPIVGALEDALYDLYYWETTVHLDSVVLCEANLKSLNDARAVTLFPLVNEARRES